MGKLLMKYFVVNPHKSNVYGLASRRAIMEYAEAIENEDFGFARDLREWVKKIESEMGVDFRNQAYYE